MTQWDLKKFKSHEEWDISKFFFTLQIENLDNILGSQAGKKFEMRIQKSFEPVVA